MVEANNDMPKLWKCASCGWVHAEISEAEAHRQVEMNGASMEHFLSCHGFQCKAPTSSFVPAKPGDAPMLSTLQCVVIPKTGDKP